MGEQWPKARENELEQVVLEGRGQGAIGRLEQQVGAALSVGHEAKLLFRRPQSPADIDLAGGDHVERDAFGGEAPLQLGAPARDLPWHHRRVIGA